MTAPPPSFDGLNQSIRRVHRSVLVLLVACGVVVWLTAAADASEATPRPYVWGAVVFGGLAILLRPFGSGPVVRPKLVVARILISLISAAGVGLVGVASAVAGGPRTTAIAYVLAGAIFALRPPARIEPRASADAA
jgi:hypothetical protein